MPTLPNDSSRPERATTLSGRLLAALPDDRLVPLCLLGVEEAWTALIERYSSLIYGVARRAGLSVADAEDVFQEVCLTLCDHLEELRETSRLPGWIATTTRRAAIRTSKRRREPLYSELTYEDGGSTEWLERPDNVTPEMLALADTERWMVRQELARLPDRCRELLTLLYVNSPAASYQEVETVLNMPLNSISPTRARCLQKLKRQLDRFEREGTGATDGHS